MIALFVIYLILINHKDNTIRICTGGSGFSPESPITS